MLQADPGRSNKQQKLEGNVLRYLRPTKSQMLMGKNFQMFFCYVQISIISKCPWCPRCPNVHDVHMSMMSKCPRPCCHTYHMWSHLSQVVKLVTCGHTCHMWSHLSQEINISTSDQKVHSLS